MFSCKSAENWWMRLMSHRKSCIQSERAGAQGPERHATLYISLLVYLQSQVTQAGGGGVRGGSAWRTKTQGDVNKVFLITRSCKDTQHCAVSLLAGSSSSCHHSNVSEYHLASCTVQSVSVNAALTLYFHSQHKSVSSSRTGICGIPAVVLTRTKADSEHNTVHSSVV